MEFDSKEKDALCRLLLNKIGKYIERKDTFYFKCIIDPNDEYSKSKLEEMEQNINFYQNIYLKFILEN